APSLRARVICFLTLGRRPRSTLFPYTTLFRSHFTYGSNPTGLTPSAAVHFRSEEHTPELQSHLNLVCRLLLEKKKTPQHPAQNSEHLERQRGRGRHSTPP